jgi:hypothetical protein
MMVADRDPLRTQLLDEIIEEMHGMKGEALDEFLSRAGFDPSNLLADFDGSLRLMEAAAGRKKFDAARILLSSNRLKGNVLNLEASRKRSVFAAVKVRMESTGEMTLAARNKKIESEEDLDSFLEACVKLGVINENGDLKD